MRSVQIYKPGITADDEEIRLEFSHWAKAQVAAGAIFIFSDEAYYRFGDHPHQKQHTTRLKGESAEEYAPTVGRVQFSLMFWDAIEEGGVCGD